MMSYHKTYRVQGIPAKLTKEDCRILLSSILEDGENLEPIVQSLGPDPYSSQCNAFQVATATFGQVPKCFQDGRDEWTLPITADFSITVDSHFSGFTPLNSINESDHRLE